MTLSSAYPAATSVRFYLAAFLRNSAGTQICRWGSRPPLHRHGELSRAKRRTDGSVRCTKKKKKKKKSVLCRPELCSQERCVFSPALKQNGLFLSFSCWQSSQGFVWCLEMSFLKLCIPKGMAEKVLFPTDAENNGNTEIYLLKTDPGHFLYKIQMTDLRAEL